MNDRFETATVGDIVANDFRTAAIFEGFGIDFCCGGRQSLADACGRVNADREAVVAALRALPSAAASDEDVTQWPIARLIDHIVGVHHAYVRQSMPRIRQYLDKLVEVHGERHPELARVTKSFAAVAAELTQHMMKEEQILFPYIRDLAEQESRKCGGILSPFGSVENPIRMMEREHRDAADGLEAIRALTANYTPPADGCRTYAVTMEELSAFERDLHRHVHLENNVLFPHAVAIEKRCAA